MRAQKVKVIRSELLGILKTVLFAGFKTNILKPL